MTIQCREAITMVNDMNDFMSEEKYKYRMKEDILPCNTPHTWYMMMEGGLERKR